MKLLLSSGFCSDFSKYFSVEESLEATLIEVPPHYRTITEYTREYSGMYGEFSDSCEFYTETKKYLKLPYTQFYFTGLRYSVNTCGPVVFISNTYQSIKYEAPKRTIFYKTTLFGTTCICWGITSPQTENYKELITYFWNSGFVKDDELDTINLSKANFKVEL